MKKYLSRILCLLLVFGLTACSTPSQPDESGNPAPSAPVSANPAPSSATQSYTAGTYTGSGTGIGGELTLSVTFSDSAITDIQYISFMDTQGLFQQAFDQISTTVLANQTLGVDMVSGASFSSRGILAAIEDAVEQAGDDAAALKTAPVKEEKLDFVSSADVVVVGSGFAGMTAALTAAEAGASVVMLEKLDALGGTSMTSGGGVAGNPDPQYEELFSNHLQALANYFPMESEIDLEKIARTGQELTLAQQWMKELLAKSDFEMYYVTSAGTKYFGDVMGKEWDYACAAYAGKVENYHGTDYIMTRMLEEMKDYDVNIYSATPATKLLVDENGAITGVEAEHKGETITIQAPAVILACGGAAHNTALLAARDKDDMTYSCIGDTGDAILLGSAVGAAVYEDQHIMGCPGRIYPIDMYNTVYVSQTPTTAIYVDDNGNRRISEAFTNYTIHAAFFQDGRDHYYAIANKAVLEDAVLASGPADLVGTSMLDIVESRLDTYSDYYVKADSLEELAGKLNMPDLVATMDTYNAGCKTGEDQFKKISSALVPMTEGPYYAIYTELIGIGTVGGVVSDEECQVLREDGGIIPGLYAAGEASNHAYFNVTYQGSFALGICLAAGRIAAQNAVKYAK